MSKVNCHTGNPLVFETSDGIRIYAGGNTRNGGWMQMKPRPDLAIGPQGVIRTARKFDVIPDGFTCVNHVQAIDTPHIIELEWPDFSIPSNVGREFWVSLVADIKTKGIKSISCQCMGGHGRTGVQLAILAHLMIEKKNQTWKDAGELIQWVRDSYCSHAVEAQSQQEYIATVCQIPHGEDKVQTLSSSASVFDWSSPSKAFDPDELEFELERNSKKKSKKKQVGKNYFTSKKSKHKTIPNTHIKGYVLYWCDVCGQYEFRTDKKSNAKLPCTICGSTDMVYGLGEMTLDDENYEDYCEVKCEETGEMFHPLETYNEISKLHLIKLNKYGSNSKNLRIKNGGKRWEDRQYKCDISGRVRPLVFLHFEEHLVCSKEVVIPSDKKLMTFDEFVERDKDVGLDKGSLDDWI
jgi:protein-tyrosine phosphatase